MAASSRESAQGVNTDGFETNEGAADGADEENAAGVLGVHDDVGALVQAQLDELQDAFNDLADAPVGDVSSELRRLTELRERLDAGVQN